MLFKQLLTTIIIIKEVLKKIEKPIIGGIKSLWPQPVVVVEVA
jgi:hypothetical protein